MSLAFQFGFHRVDVPADDVDADGAAVALRGDADVDAVVLVAVRQRLSFGGVGRHHGTDWLLLGVGHRYLLVMYRHTHRLERGYDLRGLLAHRVLGHTGATRLLDDYRGVLLDAVAGLHALVSEEHALLLAGEDDRLRCLHALGFQLGDHVIGGGFAAGRTGDLFGGRQRGSAPDARAIREEQGKTDTQREGDRHGHDEADELAPGLGFGVCLARPESRLRHLTAGRTAGLAATPVGQQAAAAEVGTEPAAKAVLAGAAPEVQQEPARIRRLAVVQLESPAVAPQRLGHLRYCGLRRGAACDTCCCSGCPQFPQNLLSGLSSFPQYGHFMRVRLSPPPNGVSHHCPPARKRSQTHQEHHKTGRRTTQCHISGNTKHPSVTLAQ